MFLSEWLKWPSFCFLIAGSSAATMLIFILPAAFYLRLVKSVPFRSPQKIGVSVHTSFSRHHFSRSIPERADNIFKMWLQQTPRCASSHIRLHLIRLHLSLCVSLSSGDHLPSRGSHLHDWQLDTHRPRLGPQPPRLQRWSLSPLFSPPICI